MGHSQFDFDQYSPLVTGVASHLTGGHESANTYTALCMGNNAQAKASLGKIGVGLNGRS